MASAERLIWELEQRRLIEETLMAYSHFVDRNDPASLVREVFCEDGRFDLGSRRSVAGRNDLQLMFAKTLAQFSRTSHHLSNVQIRFLSDEEAESAAYVYAWHLAIDDGRRIEVWGRYADRLRLTAEGWRVASRRLTVAGSDGWIDPPFELAERLANPDDTPSPRVTRA
jgi:ketosteroid isomerase-like protein